MKRVILFVLVLAVSAIGQSQNNNQWGKNYQGDKWTLKKAGTSATTWDSVSAATWSEAFLSWDYMSAHLRVIKSGVRLRFEYWSGPDTSRANMAFGRVLEWDSGADLDSTYVGAVGYWNANLTASPIPVHNYGRIKAVPGSSGHTSTADDSLFVMTMTGRK